MTLKNAIKADLVDKPAWYWMLVILKLCLFLPLALIGLTAPWIALGVLLPRFMGLPDTWAQTGYMVICVGCGYWASHFGHKLVRQEQAAKEAKESSAQVRAFMDMMAAYNNRRQGPKS